MNRRTLLTAAATLALSAVIAPAVSGQDAAGPASFDGSWRFGASRGAGRSTIERAITRAVDGMNFITQPIATGRLRDKNPLVRSIRINTDGQNVRVVFDGSRTYRGRLNQWTTHRFDGDEVRVQFRHRRDALVQLFRTDSGTRRNVYRMLPDGRMRLEVTVQSGSLPRDMSYRLTYRR